MLLKPKILETHQSKFNGQIQVVKHMGQVKILADDLLHSGSIIKNLWHKPLKNLKAESYKLKAVLILGLGGGTVVKMLSKKYPNSKITAIEIDPVMVKIAKKYFHLDQISNLEIINQDAFKYIENNANKFDLILIDLFQGKDIPEKLKSLTFYKNLKKLTGQSTHIIMNLLFFDNYQAEAAKIINIVEKEYKKIKLVRSLSNLFIIL